MLGERGKHKATKAGWKESKYIMKEKPNVLWICTDQQRFDTIHYLGNEKIDTPNLDELCKEGVAFTNTYCQSPVCTPSRSSYMTGFYPSTIRSSSMGNRVFSGDKELLSKIFQNNGYVCGLSGKLHLASAQTGREERCDDGFSEFHYSHDPWQGYENGKNEYTTWLFSQGFTPKTAFMAGKDGRVSYGMKEDVPPEFRQTKWCLDRAKDFIDTQQGKSWLFMVNTFDPHPPFDAPADLEKKYMDKGVEEPIFDAAVDSVDFEKLKDFYHQSDRCSPPDEETRRCKASYYGKIEMIDHEVGSIVRYLKEKGEWENTIIVFQSDHGEMLGDHGLLRKGCRFFEGAVKVPLIFSYGKRFRRDIRYNGLTELRDVFPTLLESCGLPNLTDGDGISLLPILLDTGKKEFPQSHRDFARCEYYKAIDARFIKRKGTLNCNATMFVTDGYKLVLFHGSEYGQLFNLQEDPQELHNLWDESAYEKVKCRLILQSYEKNIRVLGTKSEIVSEF
jgi:arylsulfatase A-like enzyme